jgi:hydrogenase maturation factor
MEVMGTMKIKGDFYLKSDPRICYLNKLNKLKEFPECQKAAIIGEVREQYPGKVFITNPMGGKRVVAMPVGEQLPRIC